jgi:hypothetical protein
MPPLSALELNKPLVQSLTSAPPAALKRLRIVTTKYVHRILCQPNPVHNFKACFRKYGVIFIQGALPDDAGNC